MIERLFPRHADNRFDGPRAALWLLGLYIALKLAMSLNSIFNTAEVAAGADGIPLGSFGPTASREVLTLFALVGLGQLALAFTAMVVLVRYRSLVPLIYLVLVAEAVIRRLIVIGHAPLRTDAGAVALYINVGLIALLAAGLALSLIPKRVR